MGKSREGPEGDAAVSASGCQVVGSTDFEVLHLVKAATVVGAGGDKLEIVCFLEDEVESEDFSSRTAVFPDLLKRVNLILLLVYS